MNKIGTTVVVFQMKSVQFLLSFVEMEFFEMQIKDAFGPDTLGRVLSTVSPRDPAVTMDSGFDNHSGFVERSGFTKSCGNDDGNS